ncbi:MAG: hypothetical protein E3J87_05220 [Candidatus Cloacimonadota bacterium]|nr:MAG: hypothetical protein E3J87_05220 [Candidatus Cloacimonadota bacterium]
MFEDTNERIECEVAFKRTKVTPLNLVWKKHTYKIEKVLLRWEEREGKELLRHFSVTDGANIFHIVFYPDSLVWKLLGIDTGD